MLRVVHWLPGTEQGLWLFMAQPKPNFFFLREKPSPSTSFTLESFFYLANLQSIKIKFQNKNKGSSLCLR